MKRLKVHCNTIGETRTVWCGEGEPPNLQHSHSVVLEEWDMDDYKGTADEWAVDMDVPTRLLARLALNVSKIRGGRIYHDGLKALERAYEYLGWHDGYDLEQAKRDYGVKTIEKVFSLK